MIKNKEVSKEAIALRAHELYVQRGGEPGRDVEDWVKAENDLNSQVVAGPVETKAARAGRN
jgi:hypothetical protein